MTTTPVEKPPAAPPASATSTAAATVAPEPIGRPAAPTRLTVRRKSGWLTAVKATPQQLVRLADQRLVIAKPGDWQIQESGVTTELVTEGLLKNQFDIRDDGALQIGSESRRRLEDLLGIGATESDGRLVALVERLARLRMGTLTIQLTPAQADEIARRADKNNRSLEQEVQQVFNRLQDELFHGTVRGASGRI